MSRLQSKVCIVTGSSSGLGRAIALAFAKEGASLVVCGDVTRSPPQTERETEGEIEAETEAETKAETEAETLATDVLVDQVSGAKGVYVQVDVTDPEQVAGLVQKAVEIGGKVDIFVNNAGCGPSFTKVHDTPETTWDATINLNLRGPFLGTKSAIQQFLIQEPDPVSGARGKIINVASTAGLRALQSSSAYCASKAAVISLTQTTALEYAADKITCNAICPGFVQTSMTNFLFQNPDVNQFMQKSTPLGLSQSAPEEIAKAAVFLASNEAAWMTGVAMPVDGGFTVHD